MGKRTRCLTGALLATLVVILLAACGSTPTAQTPSTPTATFAPTASPTATATATATFVVPNGDIACPETTSGTTTTFADTQTGLSFTFPASWTEHYCQGSSGQGMLVGNLFSVALQPRNGQTIQQMVDATKVSGEMVTLTSLADPHVAAADTVSVSFANGQGSDRDPFVQTFAIVQGSQQFYLVYRLLAQMNMTDTVVGSPDQLRQVVTTFVVP